MPGLAHVALLMPMGRDAALATSLLRDGAVSETVHSCGDVPALVGVLNDATEFVVATEEALRGTDLRPLVAIIVDQPAWSDLPFVILTAGGGGSERNPAAARLSRLLGNVTFVERPFHATTFVSVARTALRGRARQFEARARMEALAESQQRLDTAMLTGRLGAWELDIGAVTLTTTDTCRRVFGRDPAAPFSYEMLNASIHPDDRVRMQEQVDSSLVSGADYGSEYRTIWPDGSPHWAEIRGRVVRDHAGSPIRLVGVSSDITDRKLAETLLREMNESLEQRVAARTGELKDAHAKVLEEISQREAAEGQLRQVQKIESLGQLTGGVAHDFNNLLMAVLANLDLLRNRIADDPASSGLLEGAIQAAQRGASLTQRLLAFGRQQTLQVKPIDLSQLVHGMSDLIARSLGTEIDVSLSLAEGLPAAMVDANQLELALLNLVVNARDAMPRGGQITIALDQARPAPGDTLAAGNYLRLSVTDNGQGMDEETLRRAVDPFFSTKELGKGTGLGLSMIDGLVRQLKGELRLSSQVNQGTRAELWLPAAQAAAVAVAKPRPTAPPAQTAPLTILFVEDEVIIAMATRAMLMKLGHRVLDARSGQKALEILQSSEAIDLMITDFAMPKMSGMQLSEKAREMRPGLPILLATGYMNLPEGSSLDLPLLSKPYMMRDLSAKIASVIGG